MAITDSVKGNTHTLGSWSLIVTAVPASAGGASSASMLAAASFEQQSPSAQDDVITGPERIELASGRYDRIAAAVDDLLGSGLAADIFEPPIEGLPVATAGQPDAALGAHDLALAGLETGLFDELAEDLAPALV